MSFGAGPFGSVPFGSGELTADFGTAINTGNGVEVEFFGPLGSCLGALNPYSWSVASECDKCPPFVQDVESSDGKLIFSFDRQPRCGCSYVVSDGVSAFSFDGVCPDVQTTQDPELSIYLRDIANPAVQRDALRGALGTFQLSESGDLENQGGIASLRKRVIRRCTVVAGEVFSSPEYGAGLQVKRLARPDFLMVAQSKMQAQIQREPEVKSCSVKISRVLGAPEVIWVSVLVRTGSGDQEFGFEVGR